MATRAYKAESATGNSLPDFSTWDRVTIEDAIEALIALLDFADGDADFEPEADLEYDFRSAPLVCNGAGERVGRMP